MADLQPVADPTEEEWDKFWSQVRGLGKGGCEEWVGRLFDRGYGAFWYRNQDRRAHRVAYVWLYGEPGNVLDHRCDNKRCVRAHPEHVWPSTPRENTLRGTSPPAVNARKQWPDCGHDLRFTYTDPRGWRGCSICRREAVQRHYAANRDRILERKRARRKRIVHEPRICALPGCGVSFVPIRSTKRFCSQRCQATASNARRREVSDE